MKVTGTGIEEVVIIEPSRFGDERGWFSEIFSHREFTEKVMDVTFVQDNESFSRYGVIRGLHYQLPPNAQGKLIRVTEGRILDVAVDIRRGSPTFGQHAATELSAENHRQLFIPRGFAHGFSVLSPVARVQYKCDGFYAPESEGGILYNDPVLNIDWKIPAHEAIISDKDKGHPVLAEAGLFNYSDQLY